MPEARRKNESGFSLLELLASISILLVIAAGVFSALSYYLGVYQRT
jgi:prepilin-type N-terminal cleavage/methylation domain-containing protein